MTKKVRDGATVKGAEVEDRIAAKDEALERLDEIRSAVTGAERDLRDKNRRIEELRQQLEDYVKELTENRHVVDMRPGLGFGHLAPLNEAGLDADKKDRLDTLRANLSQAKEEAAAMTEQLEQLESQEAVLAVECKDLNLATSLGEITLFQEKLSAAEQMVANLRELIAKQEEIILKTNEGLPSNAGIMKQREDLLAAIAVGDATETDLEELDRQISEKSRFAAEDLERVKNIVAPARQTIAGLQRRLDEAEETLTTLESRKGEVMRRFLESEAEKAGEEYARLAGELVEKFRQLKALNQIGLSRGHRSIIQRGVRIDIPAFDLISHVPLGERKMTAAENASGGLDLEADICAEESRIKGLGISL